MSARLAEPTADRSPTMTDKRSIPDIVEQVLEVRFTPNAQVLDFRGTWAESLSASMGLPMWHIGRDRIDITDGSLQRAFVSHRNCGFVASDATTRNLHSERAQKFLRLLLDLKGFAREPVVQRFGVRHSFLASFDGSFDLLLTRLATRYAGLGETVTRLYGESMTLSDVGFSINLRDGSTHLDTKCGPVTESEGPNHFKDRKVFPSVGLFLDLDWWQKPDRALRIDEIVRMVTQANEANWGYLDKVLELISRE